MAHPDKNKSFRSTMDELTENTQLFVKSSVKSVQLEIYERLTNLIASGINAFILVLLVLFILFFLNIGIAQFIGEQLGRPSFGYFIVAGFYLFVLIAFLIYKRISSKKNTVKNAILKSVSKEHTDFNLLLEEQMQVSQEKEASLENIQTNIATLKTTIYGTEEEQKEQEEIYHSTLPRPLLTTSFNFLFKRFIFKKESALTNKLTPLIVELLVSSVLIGEGKLRTFIHRLSSKQSKKEE